MITVRPATGLDRDRLCRWSLAFFQDLAAASGDPWFEGAVLTAEGAARYVDAYLAGEGPLLVAERDGVPAGFLHGRVEAPYVTESPVRAVGHVSVVYVSPESRRQGVAQALLQAAEREFRARGLGYVQLHWHAANAAAAQSWTAAGFAPIRIFARKAL